MYRLLGRQLGRAATPAWAITFADLMTLLLAFLVNLNDPKGDRYMKVAIKLAVRPAEAVEELRDNELARARMRDRILTLLSSKTYDELSTPLGKEGLRRELQAQLEPLIADASPDAKHGKPSIQDVLFSDFVVQ